MSNILSLGTAQFGLNYGITNKKGKISDHFITKILDYANKKGMRLIDTAQAYGKAELLIGKSLPKNSNFIFSSKIRPLNSKKFDKGFFLNLDKQFEESLTNLNQSSLDILFIHKADDVKGQNGKKLIEWLIDLKNKNLVKKLGVSIYEKKDLDLIPLNVFQVVQLPLSLYDQRVLNNGTINFLSNKNIEIHCRSIFLQGLILQNVNKWPFFLSKAFKKAHLKNFQKYKSLDLNPIEVSLKFIKSQKNISAAVVGITSLSELIEINNCWENLENKNINFDFSELAWEDDKDIDPRRWP